MKTFLTRWMVALCLCAGFAQPVAAQQDILVIGDSLMEWQSIWGAAIPDVLAKETGRRVENRSASGAKLYLTGDGDNPRGVIPAQYERGNWNWVLINGGANDLLVKCGCRQCDAVLDRLISKDAASGILPQLAARIRADGPRVLLVPYYKGNVRPNLFSRCTRVVTELTERKRLLARRMNGVELIAISPVVNPQNRSHFALDGVHLSIKGARRVGTYLARGLQQLEQ